MNQIAEIFRNPRLGRGFFRDSIQRACHLDVMNQIPVLELRKIGRAGAYFDSSLAEL
jgi:hypothetical protein